MGRIFIRSTIRSFATTKGSEYDFAKDAGAIGTISTGLIIPAFAIISRFRVKVITAPTSGGAATISFGFTGSVQALMVTTGFAGFVINTVVPGVDFNANPLLFNTVQGSANEVIMTIGAAALTAGRLAFDCEFAEYDF